MTNGALLLVQASAQGAYSLALAGGTSNVSSHAGASTDTSPLPPPLSARPQLCGMPLRREPSEIHPYMQHMLAWMRTLLLTWARSCGSMSQPWLFTRMMLQMYYSG